MMCRFANQLGAFLIQRLTTVYVQGLSEKEIRGKSVRHSAQLNTILIKEEENGLLMSPLLTHPHTVTHLSPLSIIDHPWTFSEKFLGSTTYGVVVTQLVEDLLAAINVRCTGDKCLAFE
jgi:hypothetical protein